MSAGLGTGYDAVPLSGSRAMAVTRRLFWFVGAAAVVWGIDLALTTVPSSQWLSALVWLAGGVVVHDAVLAPLAIGIGLVVLPRVPAVWHPALRGALLALAVLGFFGVALVAGATNRRNPTVVPQDVGAALAVGLLVVVVGTVLGALLGGARRRP